MQIYNCISLSTCEGSVIHLNPADGSQTRAVLQPLEAPYIRMGLHFFYSINIALNLLENTQVRDLIIRKFLFLKTGPNLKCWLNLCKLRFLEPTRYLKIDFFQTSIS